MIITNLLANMVVLTLQGTIPTNTPAFQEFAFREMFNQATYMMTKWNLDLPRPITTNMVTAFQAKPNSKWAQGYIEFSNRFTFTWLNYGYPFFRDMPYTIMSAQTPDVKANDAIFEKWMRVTNLLTMQTATTLAETTMKSVGLPLDKLDFNKPKEARQEKYRWTDGKVYPLPYYEFTWDSGKSYCSIHVSGISGKVVFFSYLGYGLPYLKTQTPTNYFQMLGLPTNAVFVRHLSPPGKPPLYELREPMPAK
jgi:hypothetical protein